LDPAAHSVNRPGKGVLVTSLKPKEIIKLPRPYLRIGKLRS